MNYVFAQTYDEAYSFVLDRGWLVEEFKVFAPTSYATEGLRFVTGQDTVYVLPGTSGPALDSARRNAVKSRFEITWVE